MSNAIWELLCIEHGITAEGTLSPRSQVEEYYSCHSIFMEVNGQKYVPRCISIDLEPTVIDEIRTGAYRNLFADHQLICGIEDSSCNFARGHFTVGRRMLPELLNGLRHLMQHCDSLQGLMLVQSFGGGCGSGFTALLMEHLTVELAKQSHWDFSIVPSSQMSSAIVEPYNVILAGKSCIDSTDLCFFHDNQSLYNLVHTSLEIPSPSFNTINRLLAQIFSSITISVRYENSLNNSLDQIATNLIPFPRLHYPINFYAPICSERRGKMYSCTTLQITRDVFHFEAPLLECDLTEQRFMACCLQYRGNVFPAEVNIALSKVRQKNEKLVFVDWCPTGFKIGINKRPPATAQNSQFYDPDSSVLLMCNNTGFHTKLADLNRKFDVLFSRRSFVHWFVGEGMEEGEFVEAREEYAFLAEDYRCLLNPEDEKDIQHHEDHNKEFHIKRSEEDMNLNMENMDAELEKLNEATEYVEDKDETVPRGSAYEDNLQTTDKVDILVTPPTPSKVAPDALKSTGMHVHYDDLDDDEEHHTNSAESDTSETLTKKLADAIKKSDSSRSSLITL